MDPPVIVVGSGASGLAAACYVLERHPAKTVLLLEADQRVGGRVQTLPFGHAYAENGAAWLHGGCDEATSSPLARWMQPGKSSGAECSLEHGLRPVRRQSPWISGSDNPWVHIGLDAWTFVDTILGATGRGSGCSAHTTQKVSESLQQWYHDLAAAAGEAETADGEEPDAEGPARRLAAALARTATAKIGLSGAALPAATDTAAAAPDDLHGRVVDMARYVLGCWFGWQLDQVQEEDARSAVGLDDCRGDLPGAHLAVVSMPHDGGDGGKSCAVCAHITALPCAADSSCAPTKRCTLLQCDAIRRLVGGGCEGGMGRLIARMLASCVAAGLNVAAGSCASDHESHVKAPAAAAPSVDVSAGRFAVATKCCVTAIDHASAADGAVLVTVEKIARGCGTNSDAAGGSHTEPAATDGRQAPIIMRASQVIVAVPANVLLASSLPADEVDSRHALPAAVMPTICFSPPLPPPLVSALRSLRSGQYKKVHIAFASQPLPACDTPFLALLPPAGDAMSHSSSSSRSSSSSSSCSPCTRCYAMSSSDVASDAKLRTDSSFAGLTACACGPRFRIIEHGAVIKGPSYTSLSGILYGDDLWRCKCASGAVAGAAAGSSARSTAPASDAASADLASSGKSGCTPSVWSDAECVAALLQQLGDAVRAAGWPPLPPVIASHVTSWEASPLTGCGAYSFIPRGVDDVEALQRDLATPLLPPKPSSAADDCASACGGAGSDAGDTSGSSADDQTGSVTVTTSAAAATPPSSAVPRVFLAGEALHCEYMGSLHGAVLSGQAAARQALRADAKSRARAAGATA